MDATINTSLKQNKNGIHTLGQQVNFRTKSTLFNLYEDRYLQVLIIIHMKFTHAYGQKQKGNYSK